MKRGYFNKKMNYNSNLFTNINRNVEGPDIFVRQVWLSDDVDNIGVEIIELNTSNETKSSPDENNVNKNHIHEWNNNENGTHRKQDVDGDFVINKKAREKRHEQKDHTFHRDITVDTNNELGSEFITDYVYTSMCNEENNDAKTNHQVNCFTIINKHLMDSDSSSENNYNDTEINCSDTEDYERNGYAKGDDRTYEEKNFSYDRNAEKHTIWIYSFKNQPLLKDDDFELVNIPSKIHSSSSSSTDGIKEVPAYKNEENVNYRVATPIPAEYIPEIHFIPSPLLPIIAEITEPRTPSPNIENNEVIIQLPINSWVNNQSDNESAVKNIISEDKSTNVVNRMLLSPRERRRRSINTNLNTHQYTQLTNVQEKSIDFKLRPKTSMFETQVDLDMIVNENVVENKSNDTDLSEDKYAPLANMEESDEEDRGDHNVIFQKFKIRFSPKRSKTAPNITDPIENLGSSNWISEERVEIPIAVHNYNETDELKIESIVKSEFNMDSAGNKLLMRNKTLLKPAKWSAYLPIVGTPPSLHLSLYSNSSEKVSKSLCKRLVDYLNCCKTI